MNTKFTRHLTAILAMCGAALIAMPASAGDVPGALKTAAFSNFVSKFCEKSPDDQEAFRQWLKETAAPHVVTMSCTEEVAMAQEPQDHQTRQNRIGGRR